MGTLRERLKEVDPALHDALERSWKIAQDEWLPAMGAPSGSYNSGPHLRNMENHLDQIVIGFEEISGHEDRMRLRPVELYVLLASVLFHDLGRVGGAAQQDHPVATQKRVEREYAHLGIPTSELARCIGAICASHDPGDGDGPAAFHAAERQLSDVVIDPYGPIRQRSLAALLALVDHMDSAYTRVLPQYVKPREDLDIVGLFRSLVRGVHVDHGARIVRTVFSDDFITNPGFSAVFARSTSQAPWVAKRPYEFRKRQTDVRTLGPALFQRLNVPRIKRPKDLRRKFRDRFYRECHGHGGIGIPYTLPERLRRKAQDEGSLTSTWGPLYGLEGRDWLLAWRLSRLRNGATRDGLPSCTLLALAMGDVRRNAEALSAIQSSLALIGMPLWGWFSDYAEHLYDAWGLETCEPIFGLDYLSRLADGMWSLSTRIFGGSALTYDDLTSAVGEADVAKAQMGARRIAILTRGMWERTQDEAGASAWSLRPPLWAGETHWKWNVVRRSATAGCTFASLSDVHHAIQCMGGR